MSTHPTAACSLSDNDIQHLAAEIAQGRRPTVWFTTAAVGMDAGRSGKVVAVADPTEPDCIQVTPTGSHDTLAFGPTELTLTRPARRRTTRVGVPSRSRATPPGHPQLW